MTSFNKFKAKNIKSVINLILLDPDEISEIFEKIILK